MNTSMRNIAFHNHFGVESFIHLRLLNTFVQTTEIFLSIWTNFNWSTEFVIWTLFWRLLSGVNSNDTVNIDKIHSYSYLMKTLTKDLSLFHQITNAWSGRIHLLVSKISKTLNGDVRLLSHQHSSDWCIGWYGQWCSNEFPEHG